MGQRSSWSVFTTNRGRPGNPAPRAPLGKPPSASLHQWLWGQGPPRPPSGSASGHPSSATPSPDCRHPGNSHTLRFTTGSSGLIFHIPFRLRRLLSPTKTCHRPSSERTNDMTGRHTQPLSKCCHERAGRFWHFWAQRRLKSEQSGMGHTGTQEGTGQRSNYFRSLTILLLPCFCVTRRAM